MIKVPRFMKEYANSIKKTAGRSKKRLNHANDSVWNNTITQADRIVSLFERGLITEHEAMKMLVQLPY